MNLVGDNACFYYILGLNYYYYIYNFFDDKRKFISPFYYTLDINIIKKIIYSVYKDMNIINRYKKIIVDCRNKNEYLNILFINKESIYLKEILNFDSKELEFIFNSNISYEIKLWIKLITYLNFGNKYKFDYLMYLFNYFLKRYYNNPDILAFYSKFYASSLYKFYNKDKKYLIKGLKYGLKAQSIYEKYFGIRWMPTYIFGWNGYIYMELDKLDKAIEFFNKAIDINKKYYNHIQPEPYIWKARALTKKKEYKRSNKILLWLENADELYDEYNDKRDFRFFRRITENYIGLGNFEKAYIYLRHTIRLFMKENIKKDIGYLGSVFEVRNFKEFFYKNVSYIIKNDWNDFCKYNNLKVKYNDIYDEYILLFAWIYKGKLLGKEIKNLSLRDIDKVCYMYLYK